MEQRHERGEPARPEDDRVFVPGSPPEPPWALCHVPGSEGLDGTVYAAFRLDPETLGRIEASIGRFSAAKAAFPDMAYAEVFDETPEWFEVGESAATDYEDPIGAARYAALLRAQDEGEGLPGLVAVLGRIARDNGGGWAVVPAEWLPAWGNMRTECVTRRFTQVGPVDDARFPIEVEWSALVKHTDIHLNTARMTLADVRAWAAEYAREPAKQEIST